MKICIRRNRIEETFGIFHSEMPKRDWPNLRVDFSQRWRRLTEPKAPAKAYPDTRVCTRCRVHKPWEEFYRKSNGTNGRGVVCIECRLLESQREYAADPEKFKARRKAWGDKNPDAQKRQDLKKYGMTLEDFQSRIERQAGCCALCKETMDRPNVDHDHKTGKVRELLCSLCNYGLGHFKDSEDRLNLAIEYLKRHK